MRRTLRSSLAILIALAAAACARPGDPAAARVPASPPAPRVLAEAAADIPQLAVQVIDVRRTGPEVLTVTLQLVSTSGSGQPIGLATLFASDSRDAGTLADMFLWDETGQRKYYVLRDNAGRPRSSSGMADLAPGAFFRGWAAFPAPPPGVSRLTVCLPHMPPMRGVPLS